MGDFNVLMLLFFFGVFQMQQLELAQIRQREANLTALAAIGPRKKRKTDSPLSGASAEVMIFANLGLKVRCFFC